METMTSSISVRGTFQESWAIIKPRFWKVVGQYALLLGAFIALHYFSGGILLLDLLLSTLFGIGSVVFSLGYATRENFSFEDILRSLSFRKFIYFFFAYLLTELAILGGFILLIIPGIIAAVRLSLVRYIVIEEDIKPLAALRESARRTKGHHWKLLSFFLFALLVNILGALCVLVGLLFTMPLTLIAFTLVYKKLSPQSEPEETSSETIVDIEVVEVV